MQLVEIDEDGYLSEWETEFIENLWNRFSVGGTLTMRQMDKFDEIWEKVCQSPY